MKLNLRIISLLTTLILSSSIHKRPTPASQAQVDDFKTMQKFIAAASCKDGLETWTCNTQCTGTPGTIFKTRFQIDNTDGYIAYNPSLNAIIVTFPGSKGREDWLADFDWAQVALDGSTDDSVFVHQGFQGQYRDAGMVIRYVVKDLLSAYPSAHIRVVGHSLGGALAVFAAYDLTVAFPAYKFSVRLYTFGQPRCGNDKFAALLDSTFGDRFFRIVYKSDLVSALPSRTYKKGYLHGGIEYWIDNNDVTQVCNGNEDSYCNASVHNFDRLNTRVKMARLFFRKKFYSSLDDHTIYYPGFNDKC